MWYLLSFNLSWFCGFTSVYFFCFCLKIKIIPSLYISCLIYNFGSQHCQSYFSDVSIKSLLYNTILYKQRTGIFVFVQNSPKNDCISKMWKWKTRRTPSNWLYEIIKVPVYSLHMRYIPAYNRYVSSSSTIDQIDVNVIIIIIISGMWYLLFFQFLLFLWFYICLFTSYFVWKSRSSHYYIYPVPHTMLSPIIVNLILPIFLSNHYFVTLLYT